ncbi:phage tail protein [Erwinia sp. OLTSP20]|uniref:phage baseplate protein n=1 Tax=unclassified Erwinia TaxID=2622719 RepID=UPI000C18018D|nr:MULTISPECIES: phage tail protein [unclassified Erwinia]PIJ49235.1 phage tail protein [Erwinia sp. OAMSP11]PIJ70516.1 phage tail protein [Erwinia sp. OLSSP12]PIJ78910.1 phage tail protein [Erwinia sp. OLCASP19]PIJ81243.1 phage tail protein [Erwinia sp. OLMTSP26]PIJ84492.1 phage tail protein [Erwinia sp. OLMDSP33]
MTKVFKTPFAAQGDRTAVPVETQADGSVSYTQGYGYDYERDQTTDPAAKDIEREKMNALFHDVTEATGEMQQFGSANWSEDGKPYPIRSLVYYSERTWQSRIKNNNEEPGKGSGWIELKADINPVDMLYPVGIVTWFAQNKDPNTLFPGTTWKYIGENCTIRLASANGSDVMTTGGSDSVTLATGNLPAHGHTFSANTSSFDYGTKTTSTFDHGTKQTDVQGRHTHGYLGYNVNGGNGRNEPYIQFEVNKQTDPAGEHAHNVAIGAHNHTVGIGAHSHSVSGTTANAGSGTAFSVTNSFIKLMGWYRNA